MKKGIVVVGVIGAIVAGGAYVGINSAATSKVKGDIDKTIEELKAQSDIKEISYGDLSVNVFSQEAVLSDITAVGPAGEVKIDSVTVSDYDFINKIPRSSNVKLDNIRIPFKTAGINESEAKDFADFGIKDEIVVDVAAKHNYDESAKTFDGGWSVGIDNLGNYSAGLNLGNVNLAPIEEAMKTAETPDQVNPMLLMGIMGGLELNSASVEFNDEGVMTMAAEKLRKEEVQFKDAKDATGVREIAADLLKQQATAMGKGNNKLVRRIIKFVKSGKGIKISANPEQKSVMALGMSLNQVQQTMDLKTLEKLLGLTIDVK